MSRTLANTSNRVMLLLRRWPRGAVITVGVLALAVLGGWLMLADNRPSVVVPAALTSIKPQQMKFDLRLQDTPYPDGLPLAHEDWLISTGSEPEGMAYVPEDQVVLRGRTDEEGRLVLSDDDQERLARAYLANPSATWLLYAGQTVQLRASIRMEQ